MAMSSSWGTSQPAGMLSIGRDFGISQPVSFVLIRCVTTKWFGNTH